jgi:DNA-binding response OmpR family regulator
MGARPNILSIYALEQVAPAKDPNRDRSANFIHTMVCLIRKKIGEDAIECVHSRGFRMADGYQPPA